MAVITTAFFTLQNPEMGLFQGISFTEELTSFSIILSPKLGRTVKFVDVGKPEEFKNEISKK